MQNFLDIKLNKDITKALNELGFIKPTPIQSKTIPLLMDSDRDLIGSAQTGTGKTAAFGIPSIHLTNVSDKRAQTLILCPTRELCMQITSDLKKYAKYLNKIHIVPVYGGASIETQVRALNRGSQIVIGTPGRTKDLIKRKKLLLGSVGRIVLDEADEMLSMGFKEDLDFILSKTAGQKQTLLFSATMPRKVTSIIKEYMNNPVTIAVDPINTAAVNNPKLIDELVTDFGSANVSLSIEAKKNLNENNWDVYTSNGRDNSKKIVIEWAKEAIERGVGEIFLTSIDNDGFQSGFDSELVTKISEIVSVPLVISGGFGALDHLSTLNKKVSAIAIGSSLHYEKITIKEIKSKLEELGYETRK
mgnify:CR=1 FL=1